MRLPHPAAASAAGDDAGRSRRVSTTVAARSNGISESFACGHRMQNRGPTMRRYDLPPLAQLEAFEASARHLSFTKAAGELALTQSAVSRQIAALEAHYALPLFRRLHRALRLTDDGQRLYRAVDAMLSQLHELSRELGRGRAVRPVVVTTTPGFAGLWLIPRLSGFAALRPDVDVRISASYDLAELDRDGIDLAIRYTDAGRAGASAQRLFGEVVFPVCSPRLARDAARPLKQPSDLRLHTLLQQEGDASDPLQSWPMWLRAARLDGLRPARTLQFSMYDQLVQAAVDGQGVALGRSPLIDELLRRRRLVAPFATSLASPRSYYLLQSATAARRAEVQQFVEWLRAEAERSAAPAVSAAAAATARGRGSSARADRARP
jgi:DNA-binding transcriptional LysR family regulator